MERVLAGIEPQEVLYWFEEISRIPRGSFNEKEISDYLKRFARERGFDVRQDECWNLAIEIPATPGYESRPKVLLQAHMDMVCKKDVDFPFDFEKDPLQLYVDGDWIRARHTTLGADNGSGVAMIMAVMDSKSVKHPPLQVLFTTSEEVACTGAEKMDYRWPDGKYMINLDVFWDDSFLVSCAGISINQIDMPSERAPIADTGGKRAFNISLSGMKGGHSGEMIHEGRANAVAVLGELLFELREAVPYELISAYGEGLFNVISTVSGAELCCEKSQVEVFAKAFEAAREKITAAYRRTDPEMSITICERAVQPGETALVPKTKNRLVDLLYTIPVGMYTVYDVPCTQAESSANLGALTEDGGAFHLVMSIRSNVEYRHDQLLKKYRVICERNGAVLTTNRRIGSWEYNPDSPLRETARRVYEKQNGTPPKMIAIHAGVEVATFFAKFKQQGRAVDAVAFGCNTPNAHSTEEALQISSVGKVYRLLTEILETVE